MCGRYNITDSPLDHALLDDLGINIGPLPVRYNIAPTEVAPVIMRKKGVNLLIDMRWWLVPSWSEGPTTEYAMFNARSENLQKSRAFSKPFKSQRCIVPATSFIEWQKTEQGKQPYQIRPKEGVFTFVGVWDYWQPESIYSFSIITTAATPEFKCVHSRMPVMLRGDELKAWINTESDVYDLLPMLEPRLAEPVRVAPLDRSVNNARIKKEPKVVGEVETIK